MPLLPNIPRAPQPIRKRGITAIEPGSLHGMPEDFGNIPREGDEHRELLERVRNMTAQEMRQFNRDKKNIQALEAAHVWKRSQ